MASRWNVEPDIARAHTLPGEFYEPQVYETTRRPIFEGSWHLVADSDVVKTPGSAYPFTLLEGCLDEPLLLTRDYEDGIHCISNVCTHRGNLVCEGPGEMRQLRCRYHGRRFSLDGSFKDMPEFQAAEGFPRSEDDLPKVSFHVWKQFVFASLAPAFEFGELISPVEERVGWMPIEEFVFEPTLSKDYLVRAHWALYCDNYLEGFHIPFVHASLSDALDYGSYSCELSRYGSLQIGIAKSGEECFSLPATSPDHGKDVAAYYFWLFPNMMLNFYPWGLSINVVRPLGPALTRVSFLTYVGDHSRLGKGAGAGLDRVEREDEAVVESVQKGLRSRLYKRGRFSPTREQGVHHFHRLLAEFVNGRD